MCVALPLCLLLSPRREWCWTLPTPCPALPIPLPAPGPCLRVPTFQGQGKTGECQPGVPSFLSLYPPGRRPRALLLSFGTGHVQVSEKVGGGEPGEEPAGSGHE